MDFRECEFGRVEEEVFFIEGETVFFNSKEGDNEEKIREAKEKELESWKENEVYEEVHEVKGKRIMNTRWIISEKDKEWGKIWKARLVVKGYMENDALEREECEAPTFSIEGLKVVLAITNMRNWQVKSLDVKTAYLQGKTIERDVLVRPPKEALINGVEVKEDCVWIERCCA